MINLDDLQLNWMLFICQAKLKVNWVNQKKGKNKEGKTKEYNFENKLHILNN